MKSSDAAGETCLVIEDERLEELLDTIDERTSLQKLFHNHIADGFMSLARERYREPTSAERLGRLVYDDRDEVSSNVHVEIEVQGSNGVVSMGRQYEDERSKGDEASTTLRNRKGKVNASEKGRTEDWKLARHVDVRNSFMAVPSSEVREAIRCFRLAIDRAIELVNANNKLQASLDEKA